MLIALVILIINKIIVIINKREIRRLEFEYYIYNSIMMEL